MTKTAAAIEYLRRQLEPVVRTKPDGTIVTEAAAFVGPLKRRELEVILAVLESIENGL